MTTIYCKLIAKESDPLNYTTYVFESLDESQEKFLLSKYLMCVKFPNWDHRELNLGDVGFLYYKVNMEGIDKWFNGIELVPYQYSHIQFIKFIDKPVVIDNNITID